MRLLQPTASSPPQAAQQSPEQLQQLVAPIALYPDALAAQILAAATNPEQIVEAQKWLEKHKNLEGDKLPKEVDKESWDPGVKALIQFPAVLANINQNLASCSVIAHTSGRLKHREPLLAAYVALVAALAVAVPHDRGCSLEQVIEVVCFNLLVGWLGFDCFVTIVHLGPLSSARYSCGHGRQRSRAGSSPPLRRTKGGPESSHPAK
jgi:hypothetical protein